MEIKNDELVVSKKFYVRKSIKLGASKRIFLKNGLTPAYDPIEWDLKTFRCRFPAVFKIASSGVDIETTEISAGSFSQYFSEKKHQIFKRINCEIQKDVSESYASEMFWGSSFKFEIFTDENFDTIKTNGK